MEAIDILDKSSLGGLSLTVVCFHWGLLRQLSQLSHQLGGSVGCSSSPTWTTAVRLAAAAWLLSESEVLHGLLAL
jgi:hypothetical protein